MNTKLILKEGQMKGYNAIVVFDESKEKLLMCKRKKDPYKNLLNFVGGKIEKGEDGLSAAYRELFEETSITDKDVVLSHMMDFTYHTGGFYLEIYVGKLNKNIEVKGDENDLCWISPDENFFDYSKFAGDGNIGHILRCVQIFEKELLK